MTPSLTEQVAALRGKITQGPWYVTYMVAEDGGQALIKPNEITPLIAKAIEQGSGPFYGVHFDDTTTTICHTGNGPTSAKNAVAIALVPDLLAAHERLEAENAELRGTIDALDVLGKVSNKSRDDDIATLSRHLAETVKALKPFVRHGRALGSFGPDMQHVRFYTDTGYRSVPQQDFIDATAALDAIPEEIRKRIGL